MDKLVYVFDIDGTICTNTNGLQDYKDAKPLIERISAVNALHEQGHTIYFQTARGMGRSKNNQKKAIDEFYNFTKKQLDEWGVKYHSLFLGKPAGDLYVDDKGISDIEYFSKTSE